jgi:SAM-dependent methyltransferase
MKKSEQEDVTRQTYDQHAAVIAERFWNIQLSRAWEIFLAALPPKARIIDVGCGAGRDVFHFIENGCTAFGLDFSAGMLLEAAKHGTGLFVQADMLALPLAGSSFDGAWLSASLLHLPRKDVPGVMGAVYDRLKPGGVIYIAVKEGQGERWERREGERFFSYFTSEEMEKIVQQADFSLRQTWQNPSKKQTWVNVLAEKRK